MTTVTLAKPTCVSLEIDCASTLSSSDFEKLDRDDCQAEASTMENTMADLENPATLTVEAKGIFNRFFASLWHDVGTKNPLRDSFFVSSKSLKAFRYFSLILNIVSLMLAFVNEHREASPNYWMIFAYLTYWGLGFCLVHSALVLVWANAPDNSIKWKIVYILGEIAFTLETTICPFFMCILLPIYLTYVKVELWDIFFQMLVHLIVPIFIWLETAFNNISFPKSHKILIAILMLGYSINNYYWAVILKTPVYPGMTWDSFATYAFMVIATLLLIGGFTVGGMVHKMKHARKHVELVEEKVEESC